MDIKIIFIKTSKGEDESKRVTNYLSSDIKRALGLIDNKSTVKELMKRAAPSLRETLGDMFQELIDGGFIQDKDKIVSAVKMAIPRMPTQTNNIPSPKFENLEERQSFSSVMHVSAVDTLAAEEEKVETVRFEAAQEAKKIKLELESALIKAKEEAEALAKARSEAEAARFKAEQQEIAQAKAKVDAEARAYAETEAFRLKAEQEAVKAKMEQEAVLAKARAEAEMARFKAEQETEKIRAELESALVKAKEETEALVKARFEVEAVRFKAEQEAIKGRAEQEATRAKVEAEAKARAVVEAMYLKTEKDAVKIREKQEAEQAKAKVEVEAAVNAHAVAEMARLKAEQETSKIRSELAAEQAKSQAEAKEKTRVEAETLRFKEEQEAARIRAEQEATRAKEQVEAMRLKAQQEVSKVRSELQAEQAKLRVEAQAKARIEAETVRFKEEQEAARVRAEREATQAKEQVEAMRLKAQQEVSKARSELQAEQEKLQTEAQAKARIEAETVRFKEEQEAARIRAEHEAAYAKEQTEAMRLKAQQEVSKVRSELQAEQAKSQMEAQAKARAEAETARLKREQEAARIIMKQEAAQAKAKMETDAKVRAEAEVKRIKEEQEVIKIKAEHLAALSKEKAEEKSRDEAMVRISKAEQDVAQTVVKAKIEVSAKTQAIQAPKVEIAQRAAKTRSKPLPWGKIAAGFIALLFLLAALLPYIWPMQGYVTQIEQKLSAQLEQPVHIGYLRAALFPQPKLELEDVSIGSGQELKASSVVLNFNFYTLLNETKGIHSLEINDLILRAETFDKTLMWLQTAGKDVHYPVARMVLQRARLGDDELSLPPVNGVVNFDGQGHFAKAALESVDGKLSMELKPQQSRWQIALAIKKGSVPLLPDILFNELTVKGELGVGEIQFHEIDGSLHGGLLTGSMRLAWLKGWQMQGLVNVKAMQLDDALPQFGIVGEMDGDANFILRGEQLPLLAKTPHLEGKFLVKKGLINKIDLVETSRMPTRKGASSGRTHFDELSGVLEIDNNRQHLRQIKISTGVMSANGYVDVAANKQLSGRLNVDLKIRADLGSVPLVLSGTLAEPVWNTKR